MVSQKKPIIRKCVACGEHKEKKELLRIVKNKEDEVSIDLTGKANGRGVYICRTTDCLEKAIKTKKIANSLGVKISDRIIEELREHIME